MPDSAYVAAALAVSVAITVALRAVPFVLKSAMTESALLADIGRWMPLGAILILASYCLSSVDASSPTYRIPELVGVAVTVGVHQWRHNIVISLVAGTAACLVLANWVLPSS